MLRCDALLQKRTRRLGTIERAVCKWLRRIRQRYGGPFAAPGGGGCPVCVVVDAFGIVPERIALVDGQNGSQNIHPCQGNTAVRRADGRANNVASRLQYRNNYERPHGPSRINRRRRATDPTVLRSHPAKIDIPAMETRLVSPSAVGRGRLWILALRPPRRPLD